MRVCRLRAIAAQRGMSLKHVAELAGIYFMRIYDIADGKTNTTIDTAKAIASVLGVTVDEVWPTESKVIQ